MGAFLEKPKTEKTSHLENGTTLSYGLSAMQGWRIDMEDAHTAILSLQSTFKPWSYFGVYDGHAGSSVSEICSQKLLPSIMNTSEFKKLVLDHEGNPVDLEMLKQGIRNGFLELDKTIGQSHEVETGEDKSGSTVVSVFVTPKYIVFANCGDSRGLLIRNNAVHFNTEDHKPMNPGERDRILKAGGTVMIQRINGSLAVSRSLGDFDYKKVESRGPTEQLVSPDPEITVIEKASDEDQLIVLACDGVWDVMTNEELGEFVISRCQRVPDLSKIAEEVIDYCLYKGSRDNMSVIIITTKNAPTIDPELQSKDIKLNELIKLKVREYIEGEGNELDVNSMLIWLQSANLHDLPPGGLTAKRYLIDPLFEELCKDKQKPQNNSSESTHPISVLSLFSGTGTDENPYVRLKYHDATAESIESSNDNKCSKTTK